MDLVEIFRTIPAPSIPGLYPADMDLSFDRLCMLYKYNNNWLDAFENVIISQYYGEPEIAAFMRTMVRMVFAKFSTVPIPRSGANTQMGAVSLP